MRSYSLAARQRVVAVGDVQIVRRIEGDPQGMIDLRAGRGASVPRHLPGVGNSRLRRQNHRRSELSGPLFRATSTLWMGREIAPSGMRSNSLSLMAAQTMTPPCRRCFRGRCTNRAPGEDAKKNQQRNDFHLFSSGRYPVLQERRQGDRVGQTWKSRH